MRLHLHFPALVLLFAALAIPPHVLAQSATIKGQVQAPSGAVTPAATISLTQGTQSHETKSGADGHYAFHTLAPGSYTITAAAKGFAPLSVPEFSLTAGQVKDLNLPLAIAVEEQEVLVSGQTQGVSINPDQNASSMVIKGSD